VTAPAEKGDVRNVTNTVGAHERYPTWSPDGKSIAYFSDESGEYQLFVRNQDGSGEVRRFKLNGAGFYDTPSWSPDSQKLAYADNSWSFFWIDLKTGESKKIAAEPQYGPSREKTIPHAWSPDSKWLAYTISSKSNIQTVYAYSLETGQSIQVSDGLSEVSEPAFDRSGKYLFFFASTNAGPTKDWFALSSVVARSTQSIYVAVLRGDLPSPLARESDEEKGVPANGEKPPESKPAASESVTIDADGLNNRILAMPIPPRDYWNLQAGAAGQIYYLESTQPEGAAAGPPRGALHHYDLNTRKDEVLMTDINAFELTADGKKLLYRAGETVGIVAANAKAQVGAGRVNTDAIEVRVEPRAEWKQIFDEAW
jgi:tricorn protease